MKTPMKEKLKELAHAAREARNLAFLSTRSDRDASKYGAAVLTRSGTMHSAGQYSSYHHAITIHAEQAALILAAMREEKGNREVLAIAIASNEPGNEPCRPCGVCLQALIEHGVRTGGNVRSLTVVMCRNNGTFKTTTLAKLYPKPWMIKCCKPTCSKRGEIREPERGGVLCRGHARLGKWEKSLPR